MDIFLSGGVGYCSDGILVSTTHLLHEVLVTDLTAISYRGSFYFLFFLCSKYILYEKILN
jgi:hypothetical protein